MVATIYLEELSMPIVVMQCSPSFLFPLFLFVLCRFLSIYISVTAHQLTHITKMVIDSMTKRRCIHKTFQVLVSIHNQHRHPQQQHPNGWKWIVVIENWFATARVDCVLWLLLLLLFAFFMRVLICILNPIPEWMPEPSGTTGYT